MCFSVIDNGARVSFRPIVRTLVMWIAIVPPGIVNELNQVMSSKISNEVSRFFGNIDLSTSLIQPTNQPTNQPTMYGQSTD